MGGSSDNTPTTYEILCNTLEVATASWPIVAGALSELREKDAWKEYAGAGETWGEFLAQLPGEPMGPDKASKLIQLYKLFHVGRDVDAGVLARVHWSNLYVTQTAVRDKLVTPEEAIADAQANVKGELEALYADKREGADKLDAEAEPHKCVCPDCGAAHRRRKAKPKAAAA